ncbi:MAG: beta-ketoacyl-[acyl-carrier-protein] synthase family protein [Labilithrix sp.]|nr:beta-ketoacyl-[acyl-carrier-protein] synthase family protein [Labilithrix sp.]
MARAMRVTGMGVASPIGVGCAAFWEAIARGSHAIRRVERFDTSKYDVHVAAAIPEATMAEIGASDPATDACAALALVSAREAVASSRVLERRGAARVALVVGTSAGGLSSRSDYELRTPPDDAARRHALLERSAFQLQTHAVARALGVEGPRLTVSTACASSVHALLHARAMLESGRADAVVVGGVDVLVEELFAGFAAMGAMSGAPCAPFSEPIGMNVGEGSAFVVVELDGDAAAFAVIAGLGASADAFHATAPEPTGAGIARAVSAALADAGVAPGDVGYVNAHGTGTDANDAAEQRALAIALGARADAIPISSTKGYFGHALGAAGMLEIVATILAMNERAVPPTLHHRGDRGGGPRDPVAASAPRAHDFECALSLSLAFGGTNAAAAIARAPKLAAPVERDEVVVVGAGTLVARAKSIEPAMIDEAALADALRGHDRRGLDRCTELAIAAAVLAVRDSGLRLRGPLRDRAGIVAGAPRLAWGSADAFWGSIRARGLHRASAPAFSGLVLNAPAGAVSRALGLRNVLSVVAAGPCSALAAFVAASDLLATRRDVDVLFASSTSELAPGMIADHAHRFGADGIAPAEAAACFVLARRSWAEEVGARVVARVGATSMDDACDGDDLAGVVETFGRSEAADGVALSLALDDLRAGRRASARVVGCDPTSGSFSVEIVSPRASGR